MATKKAAAKKPVKKAAKKKSCHEEAVPRRLLTFPVPRWPSDPSRISHAVNQIGHSPAELPVGSTTR